MLHTLGYERRDLEEVVDLLERNSVELLVDVRGTPRSRKPGLSRTRLREALEHAGVEYRHEPQLGVPREERSAFRSGDPDTIRGYRDRLRDADRDAVERVAALARDRAVALLCFERDEQHCHRRIVAELACDLDPAITHRPIP